MTQYIRRDIFGRQDTRTSAQRAAYRWTPEEAEEIRKIDDESDRREEAWFFGIWTAEYTASMRAQWNIRQRAGEWHGDTEDALGITVADLKRAIAHYA